MGAQALGLRVIKRPSCGTVPSAAPVSLRAASRTMSGTSRKARPSLTQEILSYLGLANKVGLPGLDGWVIFTPSAQGLQGPGMGKGSRPWATPWAPGAPGGARRQADQCRPLALTDGSLGDPGHPQDLLELRRGQGRAEATEGHRRPR